MKERFVDINTLIDQTKLLSDMELQAYLSSLSQSQKGDFMASNVRETINAVNKQKTAKFTDLMDQVTASDNNVTSTAYYIYRTKDLKDFANDVDMMTSKQIKTAEINKEVTQRQNEINEWSNFNKLDTLYFLQILFICLSFVGILIFLMSNGYINSSVFTIITYMIAVIAAVMLVLRWRYSRYSRNGRYWHKLDFGKLKDASENAETCGSPPVLIKPPPPPKKKC
jgi:F0F1-type ATP synthase assembly protein I